MFKKFTSTLLLSTFLTACGGGGGGGSATNDVGPGNVSPGYDYGWYTDIPFTSKYSPELQTINIQAVHNAGYTGQGVVVAVIDDGFQLDHEALSGRFYSTGYDFGDNDTNVNPDDTSIFSHGTAVASSVVGRTPLFLGGQVIGSAYDARVLPVKVFSSSGVAWDNNIANGMNYATSQGADIMNISLGSADPTVGATAGYINAARNAAASGMAITLAAGNEEYFAPTQDVIDIITDPIVNGHAIAVVALNYEGSGIATFSNRCNSYTYCIAAPGDHSTVADVPEEASLPDLYAVEAGSSFAAPMVAGVLATLKEAFPGMAGDELIMAIIDSAYDEGIFANSDIYGAGRLDAEAAFQAKGVLSVATGEKIKDKSYEIQNTTITLSQSFGDALQNNTILERAVSFDELNKPYNTDLNHNIKQADHSLDLLGFLERDNKFSEHSINTETISLGFGVLDRSDDYLIKEPTADFDKNEVTYITFSSQINEKLGFRFSNNQTTGTIDTRGVMLSSSAFSEPYLNQQQATVDYKVSENIKANFIASSDEDIRNNALSSSLAYNGDDYVLNFNVGFKNEDEGFLGTESDGAFNIEDGTSTSFFGVNGQYYINDNLRLVGQYTSGISKIASNSLIDNFSDVRSDAYAIGLVSQHKDKSFGAVFSQPLKVYSGSADLTVPTGRDTDQNVIYETERVDLTSSGTERDIELFYNQNISSSESIALNAMARLEPGHSKYNDDEYIVTAKYSLQF